MQSSAQPQIARKPKKQRLLTVAMTIDRHLVLTSVTHEPIARLTAAVVPANTAYPVVRDND
jgi:hypothetical protein